MLPTLDSHLGYWLRFVSNQVSQRFAQRLEARGVTVAEWVVLRQMHGQPPLAPSLLADRLGMTRGAISKLAERLEAKRLVARAASPTDGRAQTLALTPAGAALVPALAALADENDAEFFGHLDPAARQLIEDALREIVRRHGLRTVPVG